MSPVLKTCVVSFLGLHLCGPPAVLADPRVLWSTYLGGVNTDTGTDVTVDGWGNIIVTGTTNSPGWVWGGYDVSNAGTDAFVMKLDSEGVPLWSTYLGGTTDESGYELGERVAVDKAGNILVTGNKHGTVIDGWVSGGFDTTTDVRNDGFLAKLSSSGEHLWSTYLGGVFHDGVGGLAISLTGKILVGGYTESPDWIGGTGLPYDQYFLQPFLVQLAPNGVTEWSYPFGLVGGENYGTSCGDIAVDTLGNIILGGQTTTAGWVSGGCDATFGGDADRFVFKLDANHAPLWSTYVGGDQLDTNYGIVVDRDGCILLTGDTNSSSWVVGGYDTSFGGTKDAFVAKFSPDGACMWSTYLGGSLADGSLQYGLCDVAVDNDGNVFVLGSTRSENWVYGGFDSTLNGSRDAFLVKLSSSGEHLWSTYIGGDLEDEGAGLVVDNTGRIIVIGNTRSPGWISGGEDTTLNGETDAFLMVITEDTETTSGFENDAWTYYE